MQFNVAKRRIIVLRFMDSYLISSKNDQTLLKSFHDHIHIGFIYLVFENRSVDKITKILRNCIRVHILELGLLLVNVLSQILLP